MDLGEQGERRGRGRLTRRLVEALAAIRHQRGPGGGVSAAASHLRHKSLQTAGRCIDQRGASSRALKALES